MAAGKTLPAWDKYVEKAPKNTVTIPLSKDAEVVVGVPTSGALKKLNAAQLTNDLDLSMEALFGKEQAELIWSYAEDAPASALQDLITDTVVALGLSDDAGEETSS